MAQIHTQAGPTYKRHVDSMAYLLKTTGLALHSGPWPSTIWALDTLAPNHHLNLISKPLLKVSSLRMSVLKVGSMEVHPMGHLQPSCH